MSGKSIFPYFNSKYYLLLLQYLYIEIQSVVIFEKSYCIETLLYRLYNILNTVNKFIENLKNETLFSFTKNEKFIHKTK